MHIAELLLTLTKQITNMLQRRCGNLCGMSGVTSVDEADSLASLHERKKAHAGLGWQCGQAPVLGRVWG